MIRHLKRPNISSVMTYWAAAWAMILALYFGLSAVYGNGLRQEAFAAHAYAGLTVLGLVFIRLFVRTLLPWPKEKNAPAIGANRSNLDHARSFRFRDQL
jgi:cytochrome b561